MSNHEEPLRKRYMIAAGLGFAVLVMTVEAFAYLAIFLINPEFIAPAKSIIADRGAGVIMGGFCFLFGWITRGMSG